MNQVSQLDISNATEKFDKINQTRTTLIPFISIIAQILGGIAILFGVYFAWNNFKIAQENLRNSQEGQITERYTRAVNQLGSKELEIKLGGIYALERIANESEKDYWPIIEILTAYVRKNSSVDSQLKEPILNIVPISMDIQDNESKKSNVSEVVDVSIDIQAIMIVIARRKHDYMNGETNPLNLKRTNLRKYDLFKANLHGAYLTGANLSGAELSWANLSRADLLSEANLSGANLHGANLQGAYLTGANLTGANLRGAKLQKAYFTGANLHGADLTGANLQGAYLLKAYLLKADLIEANLQEAKLEGANLSGANLDNANLEEANFEKANLSGAVFTWADLSGANLSGADLSKANLYNTKNLDIEQLLTVKTLFRAQFDPELKRQLKEKYPNLFKEPM